MINLRDFNPQKGQRVLLVNPDDPQRRRSWCVAIFDRHNDNPKTFLAEEKSVYHYYPPRDNRGMLMPLAMPEMPEYRNLPTKANEIYIGDQAIIKRFKEDETMHPYAAFFEAQ